MTELRLAVGDTFYTLNHAGDAETWNYAGSRDDEYMIAQTIDGQEYTRIIELVNDEWRCVDDPDEFVTILHMGDPDDDDDVDAGHE